MFGFSFEGKKKNMPPALTEEEKDKLAERADQIDRDLTVMGQQEKGPGIYVTSRMDEDEYNELVEDLNKMKEKNDPARTAMEIERIGIDKKLGLRD